MAKRTKHSKKGSPVVKVLLILLCLILVVDLAMVWIVSRNDELFSDETFATEGQELISTDFSDDGYDESYQTTVPTETAAATLLNVEQISLPYIIENGRLSVIELFEFNGLNPDSSNQDATDVAAIHLQNISQLHLKEAYITLTMDDGTALHYHIQDVPAGRNVLAVCQENISANMRCIDISCDAEFEEESPLLSDKLEISVTGTEITVKNVSGEDLKNLIICCHNVLEQNYYGGTIYTYPIDLLAAGEAATVTALDCFLGAADVVRVDQQE